MIFPFPFLKIYDIMLGGEECTLASLFEAAPAGAFRSATARWAAFSVEMRCPSNCEDGGS